MAVRRTPAKKAEEKSDSGFFCYIGPTIRGFIEHGKVFFGTREDAERAAERAIGHEPLIRQMIVPGGTLAEDRIKVKTPGTALNQIYRRIVRGK